MAAHLVSPENRPDPILAIETRPSRISGLAWYAVLAYKEHSFEEILPFDFPAVSDDEARLALEISPVLERLRAKLAPILVMEDEEHRKKMKSRVKLRKKAVSA